MDKSLLQKKMVIFVFPPLLTILEWRYQQCEKKGFGSRAKVQTWVKIKISSGRAEEFFVKTEPISLFLVFEIGLNFGFL